MACKDKEEFALYQISYLLEFDFEKKSFRYDLILMYLSSPQITTTSSVLIKLALINSSTILLLIITFVPLPTQLTNPEPVFSISLSASLILLGKVLVSTSLDKGSISLFQPMTNLVTLVDSLPTITPISTGYTLLVDYLSVVTTAKTNNILSSTLGPLTSAPFVLLIVFPNPFALDLVHHSLIYSMQSSSTKIKLVVHTTILSIKPINKRKYSN